MLRGIVPILLVPFDANGDIDEISLRRVVRFELEADVHGIGINGFASEAYKLTDAERERTVQIVAEEVANAVPLVIGITPGSTRAAQHQAREFARFDPAAYMVLPPATFDNGPRALVDHYVRLGEVLDAPIMVQQSPHIPMYSHCLLGAEDLAEMANRSSNIQYFKIEGDGAPARMAALKPLLPDHAGMFGGVGGITFLQELNIGVLGVIPGVGFNEIFLQAWQTWNEKNLEQVQGILTHYNPLVNAVSSPGHEFSIHARKRLLKRIGVIADDHVRAPTCEMNEQALQNVLEVADQFSLRISKKEG
jgi:dihydrodipicolinate synthase/N-acetylneuraminate lyase